jgi:dTDP-4-amino-4,6-dideoxygalactose transaminase
LSFKVKFVDPVKNYNLIKKEIDDAYYDVMSNGDLILRGQLSSFEKNLAEFVGTKYAVGVNSGYDALHLSILCAGIGKGDEVIVPAHTFVASTSAIVNAGATPVLVDVTSDYNIDINLIEGAITDKTKGIMPVHLNGLICDMERVMAIAETHNLVVIEDACQTLGGSFKNKRAGSWGLTGCWSFYPFKILGGYGDGGALTTNDADVAALAARLRYNGEDRETGEYYGHGYTCLLDNLQAAFLDVKLRHLPDWIVRRRQIAEIYKIGLAGVGDLVLPNCDDPDVLHIYQNYVVSTKHREELFKFLTENGIETLVHWRKPYYHHQALHLEDKGFPITEAVSNEVISLPLNVEMSDDEVKIVIETVRKFYTK